ncbi:MAG TPA: hypothetical protein VF554_11215, partial [Thermoanaerobaculia bacterium]
MTKATYFETPVRVDSRYSEAEQAERLALGLPPDAAAPRGLISALPRLGRAVVKKRAIRAPQVLNEAPDYPQAVSFS